MLVSHSRGRNEIKLKLFTNEVYLSPHSKPALCTTCLSACFWRLAFSFRLFFHCSCKRYQPSLNRSPVFATRHRAISFQLSLKFSALRWKKKKQRTIMIPCGSKMCSEFVPMSLDVSYVSWSYKFLMWILETNFRVSCRNFSVSFLKIWEFFKFLSLYDFLVFITTLSLIFSSLRRFPLKFKIMGLFPRK